MDYLFIVMGLVQESAGAEIKFNPEPNINLAGAYTFLAGVKFSIPDLVSTYFIVHSKLVHSTYSKSLEP